jgi:hypothetical protein
MMANFNTELVYSDPTCLVKNHDLITPSISTGKVFVALFVHTNPFMSFAVALSSWILAATEILFFLHIVVNIVK